MSILLIIVIVLLVMNMLGYKIRVEKPEDKESHHKKHVDHTETKTGDSNQ
jgi:hypothetical protein